MSIVSYLQRSDRDFQAQLRFLERAVNYARQNGVTPIAALGNESFDLGDGAFMRDFIAVPAELSGVIGVSATGFFNLKASYSNYGAGETDVSTPGSGYAVQTPTNRPPPPYLIFTSARRRAACRRLLLQTSTRTT